MNGIGLAFFKPSLVDLRLNQMWRLRLDSLKYCFLHNLRQVRSHHNWSDVVQATWTFSVSFLEGNESPNSEIVWDLGVVKCVCNFSHDLDSQLLVLCYQVSIEAVGSESLIEVGLLRCFFDVFHTEECSSVNRLLNHVNIFQLVTVCQLD